LDSTVRILTSTRWAGSIGLSTVDVQEFKVLIGNKQDSLSVCHSRRDDIFETLILRRLVESKEATERTTAQSYPHVARRVV
jgi:hypothetical protein